MSGAPTLLTRTQHTSLVSASPIGKQEVWESLKAQTRKGLLEHRCGLTRADSVTVPQAVLKNLTDALGGSYHCYSPESKVSLL